MPFKSYKNYLSWQLKCFTSRFCYQQCLRNRRGQNRWWKVILWFVFLLLLFIIVIIILISKIEFLDSSLSLYFKEKVVVCRYDEYLLSLSRDYLISSHYTVIVTVSFHYPYTNRHLFLFMPPPYIAMYHFLEESIE